MPALRTGGAAAGLLAVGLLAACSSTAPGTAGSVPPQTATGSPSPYTGHDTMPGMGGPVAFTHIHAAVRDPRTGTVLLATHEGLFVNAAAGWARRGPALDLMGFTIAPDGAYLASGHPGAGTNLPQPLGVIRSTDAGRTWTVLSRPGQLDFHALAASPGMIVGYDGTLLVSSGGTSWTGFPIPAEPYALAASPAGRILATTAAGLLSSSDRGRSWTPVPTPALLLTVAFADANTITAATTSGTLIQSTDGGATWRTGPQPVGAVSTVSATRTGSVVEILAVVGDAVIGTTDLGATHTLLT